MTKPSLNQSTENADLSTLTPAMRQFIEIRTEVAKQHPNILLLYRMGDFYETFFEDAVEINRLLGITLTSRGKGKPDAIPMAGVPFMTLDSISRASRETREIRGNCGADWDPAAVKGTMPRKLVRIVTPGTITEDELLPAKADAALIAVCPPSGKKSPQWSVVSLVLSSGAFKVSAAQRTSFRAKSPVSRLRKS